jgi:hypothetical protein
VDTILQELSRAIGQLVGRVDGPLHFRLFMMPTVASILAVRADLKDAREGRPALLGAFVTDPVERRRLLRGALNDVGRVFLVAIVLDTAYQLWVFRWVYPLQVLIVAVTCAVVPYALVRGPILRTARLVYRAWASPARPMVDAQKGVQADDRTKGGAA